MKYLTKLKPIYIIILLFFLSNLFFLTNFPFVHSDESWLSGLSRNMLQEKNLSVTEPFFDLYPRHPHAIKLLFQLIQIIFMKIMGYNIHTFRFISLLAGTTALYLFYKLAQKFTNINILAIMATIMMGVDIQFIYASRFARQEIIILLILLITFYYYLYKYSYKTSICPDIIMGLILGTAIGIHPNSFVIALPFIIIYTYNLLIAKNIKLGNYMSFGVTLGLIALFFVALSFKFDPNFIHNYASYGEKLGVFSSILTKIGRLDYFYKKLFYRISGTYYTPLVKFQFIIFALTLIFVVIKIFLNKLTYNYNHENLPILKKYLSNYGKKSFLCLDKDNKNIYLILMFLGINAGYIIIGRYNQTGIIFIFPFCYLLIVNIISKLKRNYSYIIAILIIAILICNTTSTLIKNSYYNYDDYLTEIAKVVDKDDQVLANLNADYYFNNGKLLDYRNLAYLKENSLSFSEYIKSRKIKYIIYPQEMDFIYNNRPVWNMLYGNLFPYYQEMKNFLNSDCEPVYSFTNKTYGTRIARYVGKQEWKIKIYRVYYERTAGP